LPRLTIVFHDAGGGHRSTADALKMTLERQPYAWEVNLLDLQTLLDPLDVVRRLTGVRIQETYNLILRKGWTRISPQLLRLLQGTIRIYHRQIVAALQNYWRERPSDLVLSVIPHFNREIARSLEAREPRPPFVTLLTDLADHPPRFWIERESEYIITGTERAYRQALQLGHPAAHVFQISGMVLKPRFYRQAAVDRAAERRRLGLHPDCPTGIVLFGGYGSSVMLEIVGRLSQSRAEVQLILLCGHNQKLAAKLRSLPMAKRLAVQEFTTNVEFFMSLADFFIGKPGPGSLSEALQFHLPVIVECNSRTLPQERYNAQWITENRYGIVIKNFREIGSAVEQLLAPAVFAEFRRNASRYSNRALLEVPEVLERCLQNHPARLETRKIEWTAAV
jgi:1,2-diacylglycerol 3-beta-galactosyltransferase